jgi:hypothetical protein
MYLELRKGTNRGLAKLSTVPTSESPPKKAYEAELEVFSSGEDLPPPPSGKRKVIVAQRPNNFLWTLKVHTTDTYVYIDWRWLGIFT